MNRLNNEVQDGSNSNSTITGNVGSIESKIDERGAVANAIKKACMYGSLLPPLTGHGVARNVR
jgi:hypothetical protein